MEDFNADILTDSTDSLYIQSLANELFRQVVNTHRPFGSLELKTCIDWIFVDDNDSILKLNNIPPHFRSHHNLIDVEISLFI